MYKERTISHAVFRAYDIRGIIGEELDENAYYTIGRALATYLSTLQRDHICVARDGRLTSEQLATALIQGLLMSGIHVIDIGEVSTPVMYFATHTKKIDSGLIVTGSHNPANYNGLKIVLAGKTLVKEDIDTLYTHVLQQKYPNGIGTYTQENILPAYSQRIFADISLARPLKVVVDCGNGITGAIAPFILTTIGCEVIPLFCEVDGSFPHHHPDPSDIANLTDLQQTVLHHQADIGLAFDGDGDRLGVITEQGKIIWPDRLMMYYAQHLLTKRPKERIVFDVKCSSDLAKVIKKAGGTPQMCPTGHSIVKQVMKSCNAILAGEMSGHFFFKDRWYGFDDALYSACRLLELISHSTESISQQFTAIPDSVNTPEIKIPIAEKDKFPFMQRFCEMADFRDGKRITIDGLRVEFPNGWGILRASNTTPCLIARFEAIDAENLASIQLLFKKEIQKIQQDLSFHF